MNLISADSLSLVFGDKIILDKVTMGVEEGNKIAIIGNNGSGKSTLIRILCGLQQADEGNITRRNNLSISILPQKMETDENISISTYIFQAAGKSFEIIREYEECLNSEVDDAQQEKLGELTSLMDSRNLWNMENKAHALLSELGIIHLKQKMQELSGGMMKKVMLCRALMAEADVLFLDEPTNHLDTKTILWLERYLTNSNQTIVMVSHDRYFLEKVCNTLVELEESKLYKYNGNYSYYLEKKADRLNSQQREQEKLTAVLRQELKWLSRGPRARAHKDKKRKDNISLMQGRQTEEAVQSAQFDIAEKRSGKKILVLKDICHNFTDNLIVKDFSYEFSSGEHIGIAGNNGSGKTTLLQIIAGTLAPVKGIRDCGINTHIGYFDQHSRLLPQDKKVIEYIKNFAEDIALSDGTTLSASRFLERFLIDSRMQYSLIEKLSGGEQRKLYLLSILIQNPNFLILDEPANDLDITTLSMLEDFLDSYSGCLIVVSHDRWFLNKTTTKLLIVEKEGAIVPFSGDYADYLSAPEEKKQEKTIKIPNKEVDNRPKKREKKGLSFKEQKEFEKLEEEIIAMEEEKEALEDFFSKPDPDREELAIKQKRYASMDQLIEEKQTRWEDLADKL